MMSGAAGTSIAIQKLTIASSILDRLACQALSWARPPHVPPDSRLGWQMPPLYDVHPQGTRVTQEIKVRSTDSSPVGSTARVRTVLAIVMVAGFALRLIAMEVMNDGLNSPFVSDETSYARLATALAEGRGYVDEDGTPHIYRPPGVPFLVSLAFRITEPRVLVARVFMCALGTMLIPVCYLLGASLGNARVGLLSAVSAAVFPNWVYYSGWVLTDLTSATLVGLAAWMLIEGWRRNALLWFAAGGAAWGLAALTRPTCLAFGPAVVLWVLVVMPNWRRRTLAALVTCVALAAMIAPWAVRNTLVHDQFVFASSLGGRGGMTLWVGNNPNATGFLSKDFAYFQQTGSKLFSREDYPHPLDRANAYKADAVKFVQENPGRFVRLCAVRFVQLWKVYSPRVPLAQSLVTIASFGVALLFFLIQAARRGWRRSPEMLMLLLIASQTAVHMVFAASVRYRIPIEPLVLVMAAAGFFWSFDRLRKAQPG